MFVIFFPFVSGKKQHTAIAMRHITPKIAGGIQKAALRPTINGDRAEPILEAVEEAPIAMFRATVGNNSVVKTYLGMQEQHNNNRKS